MRRDGWTVRSSLWLVLLVALGLRVATSTWNNLKRGSVEYHRHLAERCEIMTNRRIRMASTIEDELRSLPSVDPAIEADHRRAAIYCVQDARSYSLQAAALAKKAELCEQSRVEWIFLPYQTSRNPPDFPVQHVSGSGRPWIEIGKPAALLLRPIMATLAHVDFFGLACLALAFVARRRFARTGGVGGRPPP